MKHGSDKLVFLFTVPSLATRNTDWLANFTGAVMQAICFRRAAIRIAWKYGGVNICFAYIVKIIGIGVTVQDFKTDIEAFIQ